MTDKLRHAPRLTMHKPECTWRWLRADWFKICPPGTAPTPSDQEHARGPALRSGMRSIRFRAPGRSLQYGNESRRPSCGRSRAHPSERRVGRLSTAWWRVIAALMLSSGVQSGLVGQPVLLELEVREEISTSEEGQPADTDEPTASPAPRRIFEVSTFSGKRTVTGFEVEPASQVYALVLADSLLEEDWARVEAELVGLRQGLGRRTRLKLAIAKGSELWLRGPFRSADQLRRELRAARPPEPEPQPQVDEPLGEASETPQEESITGADRAVATGDEPDAAPETGAEASRGTEEAGELAGRLYRQLGEAAPVLGCDWLAVLAVGRLPELDSSLSLPAAAYLGGRMRANRVRFSLMPLDSFVPAPADRATLVTGGTATGNVSGFLQHLESESRFMEVEWEDPRPSAGFHGHTAEVRDTLSGKTWMAPSAAEAPGWRLPQPLALRGFSRRAADLLRALRDPSGSSDRIPSELKDLEAINPSDETLLRASIRFHRRNEDWEALAGPLRRLSEIRPTDPVAFANLGALLVRLQRWSEAEPAFARLKQLKPSDPKAIEALGRVHARLENYRRALDLFDESLALDPANQALWFHKADIAREADDSESVLQALRAGVDLPDAPHARRAELIRLYLESGRPVDATEQVELGAERAGNSPEFLEAYATFWEELGHPEHALKLWERAAGLDPESEPAAAASARIHYSQGRPGRTTEIARSAVQRFPGSVRLHLTLARSLEASHRYYDLRRALRAGLGSVPDDLELLGYHARVEDTFGAGAPAAYRALAERMAASPGSTDLGTVLERGFSVSLRQNDIEQARWFASRADDGGSALSALIPGDDEREATGVSVPGGMRALAFFANANTQSSPALFFQEFCRPIVYVYSRTRASRTAYEDLVRRFGRYFRTISDLESLRDRGSAQGVSITLSVKDRNSLRKTRKVLGLLGWRLRGGRKGYSLQPIESESGAERQEIASALEIDELAIQEALAGNQDYVVRMKQETAHLALGEEAWRSELYAGAALDGGFAEAVVRDPRIGAVYIGINQMHPDVARAVVESVGLKRLVARFPDVLVMHGSSLAVLDGVAAVPGGAQSLSLWTNLVGARPDDPDRFFPRLLRKEDGRLLGYYSALGQLDGARRGFITHSSQRVRKFFELYKSSPEFQDGGRTKVRESPFLELLQELPLDPEGGVAFPGGAEVWMVAKGGADASRLARRIHKKVVPDVEDEILVRLARTRFPTPSGARSQVDKFLAVSRLERLRNRPMDPVTALNFAQAFGPYETAFPYFATLTGLQSQHLRSFLAFARSLESIEIVPRNHLLALFHSLAEILCVAQLEGHLTEEGAADLFASMCQRLSKGKEAAAASDGALETVREVLAGHEGDATGEGPDRWLRVALGIEADAMRRDEFAEVLRLQSVPTLAALLQAHEDALVLASGKGDLKARLESLDAAIRSIPNVAVTKEMGFKELQKQLVSSFEVTALKRAQGQLAKAAARRRVRLPEMERRSRSLRANLLPHVVTALTGIVYAYYLRPDDLPVAEDPLFLRKHEFFGMSIAFQDNFFPRTVLRGIGQETGPHIMGGFAGFPETAGHVAQFGLRVMDPDAHALTRLQFGSLRAARWGELRDTDMRRFALTVLLGREWIVAAARDGASRSELAGAVAGLLSVNRTQQLFTALSDRNWSGIWGSVSLSDLYRIGRARSSDSPVAAALASLPAEAEANRRMDVIGAIRPKAYGYSRRRIWTDPPYEEYERYLSDASMAERVAELKLYLVREADAAGLSVEQLARVAEPVARSVLSIVEMGDFWDWRSVTKTFDQLTGPALKEAHSR